MRHIDDVFEENDLLRDENKRLAEVVDVLMKKNQTLEKNLKNWMEIACEKRNP